MIPVLNSNASLHLACEDLTPRQQEILLEISFQRAIGKCTIRSLNAALGIKSPNGLSDALRKLKRLGYIAREKRIGNTIRIKRPLVFKEVLNERAG